MGNKTNNLHKVKSTKLLTSYFLLLALSACSLAPKFDKPEIATPEKYKEDGKSDSYDASMWVEAKLLEDNDRKQWWKIFADKELDALENQAKESNQSLKIIEARVSQSRDIASAVKGGFFPSVNLGANAVRTKQSSASLAAFGVTGETKPYTIYSGEGVVSYEADLFGRVRDSYKASKLDADAQEALYNEALLALQADVAQHYFSIRALDSERRLLQATVRVREEAARIMGKRFKEGAVGEQDNSRTISELASSQADLIALNRQRARLEHALAVLLGKMPSEFSLKESPLEKIMPPKIPAGLPSTLLARRPDIAAALKSMEAANTRIGVAKTAFFPRLNLTASAGLASTSLGNVFDWSGRTWALGQVAGNALSLPIFNGGTNSANLRAAKASYEESIATYRQQVLVAFRDVEDNLVGQNLLAKQSIQQDLAAKSASRTTALAQKRYNEGETDYFEVVDSQRVSLAAQRSAVQLRGQRFITTIALIRALGGGWEDVEVAKVKK